MWVVAVAIVSGILVFNDADATPGLLTCQRNYATSTRDCLAVVTLADCQARETAGLTDPATLASAEQFLREVQTAVPGCENVHLAKKPEIRAADGNLEFEVAEDQDVKFFRMRRETISLWDMAVTLAKVRTDLSAVQTNASMAATLQASISTVTSGLLARAEVETQDTEQRCRAYTDSKMATLQADQDESRRLLAALDQKVANKTEITASLATLGSQLAATQNQVNVVKSDLAATAAMTNALNATFSPVEAKMRNYTDAQNTLLANDLRAAIAAANLSLSNRISNIFNTTSARSCKEIFGMGMARGDGVYTVANNTKVGYFGVSGVEIIVKVSQEVTPTLKVNETPLFRPGHIVAVL